VIRDEAVYETAREVDWVSGACMLLRREAVEQLGGLDEGFFMYCEDTDLCRRLLDRGWTVRYEPSVVVPHEGGASAPRTALLPVLAASRRRYAAKHSGRVGAALERVGLAVEAALRIVVSGGGRSARRGHARAFGSMLGPSSRTT
jgi:N-acetylglucosaminyl-diphospho-decaprenol L-rhamnosyltransferase